MNRTSLKRWLTVLATLLLAVLSFVFFSALSTSPFAATGPTPTEARPSATTNAPTAIASQTPRPSAPPTGTPTSISTLNRRDAAIANIRACLAQPDLLPRYSLTVRNSRYPEVAYDVYEVGRYYAHVYTQTSAVESIGPGGDLPRAGVAPTPDLTPRYTPAQLEAMARAFIARCAGGPNLDALTPNHTRSPTTTESVAYFFRWEDRSRVLTDGVPPLIQVGFTRGGDFLNYSNWLELSPLAKPITPQPTINPNALLTPVCWSARAPMPTATPTPLPYWLTRTPGLPVVFPCGSSFSRQSWLTHTGTGITQTNRAILDLHPNVRPPVLTIMYPPSWKRLTIPTGFGHDGRYVDQTNMDFVLNKHEPGIPESRGETPATSDVFIHFVLVLDDASPDDYDDTTRLGFGALGMVIAHGTFHGSRAAFMYFGDTQRSFQRHILFQVAPGVLILIYIEFPLIQGSSPAYVQQTLAEIDGILDGVRVAY